MSCREMAVVMATILLLKSEFIFQYKNIFLTVASIDIITLLADDDAPSKFLRSCHS